MHGDSLMALTPPPQRFFACSIHTHTPKKEKKNWCLPFFFSYPAAASANRVSSQGFSGSDPDQSPGVGTHSGPEAFSQHLGVHEDGHRYWTNLGFCMPGLTSGLLFCTRTPRSSGLYALLTCRPFYNVVSFVLSDMRMKSPTVSGGFSSTIRRQSSDKSGRLKEIHSTVCFGSCFVYFLIFALFFLIFFLDWCDFSHLKPVCRQQQQLQQRRRGRRQPATSRRHKMTTSPTQKQNPFSSCTL